MSNDCQLYVAGHTVHYIQALRSGKDPHTTGRLLGADGNMISVELDGQIVQFRNHDVNRLVGIIGIEGTVRVCTRYSILKFDNAEGTANCFSIAAASDPWRPCDVTPLTNTTAEGLAERMDTHGGFLVPMDALRLHLEE
jgi:hypothetical protein